MKKIFSLEECHYYQVGPILVFLLFSNAAYLGPGIRFVKKQ